MVPKERVKQKNPVAVAPRIEAPKAHEVRRKRPVGLFIGLGLLVITLTGFAFWLDSRGNEPGITARDRAQLEELNRTGKVSGLEAEVNRNIAEFQRQQGTSAPVVVPSTRSDFKAEYKITGPAAKEIEFKFVPSNNPKKISWEVVSRTDKPLQITRSIEYRDPSGNVLYSVSTNWGVSQNKKGEMISGGNDGIEQGAQKLIISLEARYAE